MTHRDPVFFRSIDSQSREIAQSDTRLNRFDIDISVPIACNSHDFGEAVSVGFVESIFEALDPGPGENENEENETESEGEPST